MRRWRGLHSLLTSTSLPGTFKGEQYSKDVGYHSVSHDKKPITKEKKTYNTTKRTILVNRSVDDQMSGSDTEETEGEEEEQVYRHRPKNNKRPVGDCLVGQHSRLVVACVNNFVEIGAAAIAKARAKNPDSPATPIYMRVRNKLIDVRPVSCSDWPVMVTLELTPLHRRSPSFNSSCQSNASRSGLCVRMTVSASLRLSGVLQAAQIKRDISDVRRGLRRTRR